MGYLNLGNYNFQPGVYGSISNSAFINLYPGSTLYLTAAYASGNGPFYLPPGQILEGGGIFQGNLQAYGIVAPGNGWYPNTMSLTVQGNAYLQGATWMNLNKSNATNSDQLVSSYAINYGGSLIVSNIGPALAANDTFTLFRGTPATGGYTGSFTNIVLPALPSYLMWSNNLALNGSITVVPAPAFANVDYSRVAKGIIGFNATNFTSGGPYTLLSSTNLALPLSQWNTVITGNFDVNGSLNGLYISNLIGSKQFFILRQ